MARLCFTAYTLHFFKTKFHGSVVHTYMFPQIIFLLLNMFFFNKGDHGARDHNFPLLEAGTFYAWPVHRA